MHIELHCCHCGCDFVHETALYRLRDQDQAEAEVFNDALGDGGTVEDALHTALAAEGDIHCPDCEAVVPLGEEELSRMAMTMLASW